MTVKLFKIWTTILCLLAIVSIASAGVVINGVEISDDGKIIFLDKTSQVTATLKGDTGEKGDKGDPGIVDKLSICQTYLNENEVLPPFCTVKKTVFVTSQLVSYDLGGLSGADSICQNSANSAGLTGIYKAWLSDSVTSASARLAHHHGQYIRTDGAIIANNWNDLTDGSLQAPIYCDEYANCQLYRDSYSVVKVYTGTDANGEKSSGTTFCSNWVYNNDANQNKTTNGVLHKNDYAWTAEVYDFIADCPNGPFRRLYCFQQ